MTAHFPALAHPDWSPSMNFLEIHNQHTLERLNQLREQIALERQLPRVSVRHQLARVLRNLSERLEPKRETRLQNA
jgi:hypothetical protein